MRVGVDENIWGRNYNLKLGDSVAGAEVEPGVILFIQSFNRARKIHKALEKREARQMGGILYVRLQWRPLAENESDMMSLIARE
jgi:hypothetical protein